MNGCKTTAPSGLGSEGDWQNARKDPTVLSVTSLLLGHSSIAVLTFLFSAFLARLVLMNPLRLIAVSFFFGLCAASAFGLGEEPLFHSTDALAARDEWGLLTPGPLNATDFAYRERSRLFYYSQPGKVLASDPAYVGALQACLQRKGYYSGPIDGVFSPEVSDAICRLQKAHAMRVTGQLSIPVRRALYLP